MTTAKIEKTEQGIKEYTITLYKDSTIEELYDMNAAIKVCVTRLFDWHDGDELMAKIQEQVWRKEAISMLLQEKGA